MISDSTPSVCVLITGQDEDQNESIQHNLSVTEKRELSKSTMLRHEVHYRSFAFLSRLQILINGAIPFFETVTGSTEVITTLQFSDHRWTVLGKG